MYYFAAAQETSTLKLPACFENFKTEEGVLRVNKSKITRENTFNGGHFDIECNHGSSSYEKTFFWLFLQIWDQCFNPWTAKYVYIRFSSIVWILQFLSHFLWVLKARRKLILFYTKFWVNRVRFLTSIFTSLLLRRKPVQWNYWHLFLYLNEDHFDIEGNHGSSKERKKFVLGIFPDLRAVL